MDSRENDHKYINEIWRRINIKEYDKIQLQKIKENKKTLKRTNSLDDVYIWNFICRVINSIF